MRGSGAGLPCEATGGGERGRRQRRQGTAGLQDVDIRVSLLLVVINGVAITLCKSEASFVALFAMALMWLSVRGAVKAAVLFAAAYAALYGLMWAFASNQALSVLMVWCTFARHLLIPLGYAKGLIDAPTGTLLAMFERLRVPKALGVSLCVLVRFMPTIAGEFRAIRSSLKFRNVGVGLASTIAHLPRNYEATVVPLLIRTTRVADELTAAAMVRGVRLNAGIVPFEELRLDAKDAVAAALFAAGAVTVTVLSRTGML